jgi:predicted dehydrogenase
MEVLQIMKKLGFAIVGCGNIVENHIRGVLGTPEAELVCVVDVVEAKAKAVGEKYNVKYYTDVKEMLKDRAVDIVTIALPSGLHMDVAIAAMEAGKHAISEKPIEINLEKIDKMITVSKKTGMHMCGIFQSRFYDSSLEIKKAVEEGKLGRVVLGGAYNKWYRAPEYYKSSGWRATWEMDGGGALMNQAIHAIDLLQFFMGEVESVSAYCETLLHEIQVEDTAVAILRFRNGSLGTIEGTTSVFPGEERKLEICGSKGTVTIIGNNQIIWKLEGQPVREEGKKMLGGSSDPKGIDMDGHTKQFNAVTKAILAGKIPPVPAAEARKSVELIMAIYKSAKEKREIKLPL